MSLGDEGDLFDLVHESVFTRSLDGRIGAWNAASAALYGYPASMARRQDAHDLLRTRHTEPLDALQAQLLRDGRWEGELRRTSAGGDDLLIESRWALRRDAHGAPVEVVEFGRDVTASRAAETALKRSEHRYRNLFQAMAACFWELDFFPVGDMLRKLREDGVADFAAHFASNPFFVREMMRATRIVDVNEQTVATFGRGDKAELTGSVEPFWPEASSSVFAASVLAAITRKPNYSAETRLRTLEGVEFDALFTACFPPDTMNKGTLLIGVIDISDRVAAQTQLRRVQAEFAHAARISMLGELTASIAHEVNQPLAAIAAGAAAGRRWLDRDTPDLPEVAASLERIAADSARAAEIIARVRAMAMPSAPAPVVLSVNDVVEQALVFLHHELQGQAVEVVLDLAPSAPRILADRIQLQQVVANLAVNAIQAMAGVQGRRAIGLTTFKVEGGLRLEVHDSGPGIDAAASERLFDSFFTTKAHGMGMGLPICRSIVEAHGGRLAVIGSRFGGAAFAATFPEATAGEPPHTKV